MLHLPTRRIRKQFTHIYIYIPRPYLTRNECCSAVETEGAGVVYTIINARAAHAVPACSTNNKYNKPPSPRPALVSGAAGTCRRGGEVGSALARVLPSRTRDAAKCSARRRCGTDIICSVAYSLITWKLLLWLIIIGISVIFHTLKNNYCKKKSPHPEPVTCARRLRLWSKGYIQTIFIRSWMQLAAA